MQSIKSLPERFNLKLQIFDSKNEPITKSVIVDSDILHDFRVHFDSKILDEILFIVLNANDESNG